MTTLDAALTTPTYPKPAKTSLSIAAVVSLAGAVLLLVIHMSVRLLSSVALDWDEAAYNAIAIFGILSLVPILSGIVLGHIGIRVTRQGLKSGRVAAVAGVTAGYLLLALYLNRFVVVVALSFQTDAWPSFLENLFWYA